MEGFGIEYLSMDPDGALRCCEQHLGISEFEEVMSGLWSLEACQLRRWHC